uniref:Uncharacterized protein n=1 Tax=Opuntia streptacantha TaxID=393608 RepID=A0A7C9EUN8_OPUST
MPSKHFLLLLRITANNLNGHLLAFLCNINCFVIILNGCNPTNVYKILGRDANWSSHLSDSFKNIHSQDNRILLVEHTIRYNLKYTRKDCFISSLPPLFLLDIFNISLELIKEVINDISHKDLNTNFLCIFPCLWCHLNIKS